MYVDFQSNDRLNQGDIISNVVLSYIPKIANPSLIVGDQVVQRSLSEPFDPAEDLLVLSQLEKAPIMILTQGCDIDNRNFISVARIFPFNDRTYSERPANRRPKYLLENFQQVGVRPTVYYLQESQNFPRSLVSFLEIHTIKKTAENLEYLQRNRILRLTSEAVEDLQFRLAFFFGRFAALTDDYMLTAEEKEVARRR